MNDLNIPLRNIYYMLTYAYRSLNIDDYKKSSTEEFKNLTDLYTEILLISVSKLIKRGLWKEYKEIQDNSTYVKKFEFTDFSLITGGVGYSLGWNGRMAIVTAEKLIFPSTNKRPTCPF